MESHQPRKNQETGGRPEGQEPKQRRFRIVKLEERIAPAKPAPTAKCVLTYTCYADRCRW